MAFEVVMPRLGWNMESGAVSAWCKRDGEPVKAGEILFEIESEKAVQDVEALESGTLRIPPQSPALGVQVPVGTLLAWLLGPGERIPAREAVVPRPSPPERPSPPPRSSPAAPHRETAKNNVTISPRARRTAAELGIDWEGLSGTGSTGRIRERDVREAARRPTPVTTPEPAYPAPSAAVLTAEVDATDLAWLLCEIGRGGADPAPTHGDFIVKAAAHALENQYLLNARRERTSIARPTDIRIAIGAEGVHDPLVLPDPRPMSLRRFARESADLLARARTGRLGPVDTGRPTVVVRDLGPLAVDAFTPAREASSCPVLGVGRIVAKQVVTDPEAGRLAIREMVTLSLVLDPRRADAAAGARFLRQLAWFVEHPVVLLVGA